MPRLAPALLAVAAACALAAPAYADTSSATSVSTPIRIASMAGWTDGQAKLAASYTSSQATFTATSTSIALAAGKLWRVSTCLQVHVYGSLPNAVCTPRTVDTTGRTTSYTTTAPTVTQTVTRPGASGGGYADATVTVDSLSSTGAATHVGSSWPDAGLPGASLAIFAQGASSGALPAHQGPTVSSGATGGVDTGNPDSMCLGNAYPSPGPAEAGVSTTALGTLPDYYEVGEPTGTYAGSTPKGIMIVIHGGGWALYGPGQVNLMRGEADRWRARGWRTVNIDYRPCGASVGDVLGFYAQVRAKYGSSIPVCALGASAGGEMALELAAFRTGVSCVVDEAGPTDGTTIATQPLSADAAPPNGLSPAGVGNTMVAAFGAENLYWYSPVKLASALVHNGVRVLAVGADSDPWVPYGQMSELAAAIGAVSGSAYAADYALPAGDQPFVHSGVSQAGLDQFHQLELDLVAPIAP